MYDNSRLLETLADFTRVLLTPYEVEVVLAELAGHVSDVLSLLGSGVTIEKNGRLLFDTSHGPVVSEIELTQSRTQSGPCVEAFRTGQVIAITDLETCAHRWPEYSKVALSHGVVSVAAVPMHLDGHPVGALDLYADGRREWDGEDLVAAEVLANMGTAYLINARHHRRQVELTEQLQEALDNRVVIEQAKGMIAARLGSSPDHAFERLRQYARSHNASVHAVARAVVDLGLSV